MVTKCLNPACEEPFRYFRQGKIFNIQTDSAGSSDQGRRRVEHFWLCDQCASVLRVVLEDGQVTAKPISRETTPHTPRLDSGNEEAVSWEAPARPRRFFSVLGKKSLRH